MVSIEENDNVKMKNEDNWNQKKEKRNKWIETTASNRHSRQTPISIDSTYSPVLTLATRRVESINAFNSITQSKVKSHLSQWSPFMLVSAIRALAPSLFFYSFSTRILFSRWQWAISNSSLIDYNPAAMLYSYVVCAACHGADAGHHYMHESASMTAQHMHRNTAV